MNDNTIVLRKFNDQFEALMSADMLKSAGIDCFLSNDNLSNTNPLIMVLPTIVHLRVFEKDVEIANAILQDMEHAELDGDDVNVE